MTPQGNNEVTRIRHMMRTVRAKFMANVRAGIVPRDDAALAYFDDVLGRLDAKGKTLSRQR